MQTTLIQSEYKEKIKHMVLVALRDNPELRSVSRRVQLYEHIKSQCGFQVNPETTSRMARLIQNDRYDKHTHKLVYAGMFKADDDRVWRESEYRQYFAHQKVDGR